MGQKVHPKIFRIGLSQSHLSRWFSQKDYRVLLKEDIEMRKWLKGKLREGGVSKIEIERSANNLNIIIYSSRPGVIIGRGGGGIEELKKEINKKFFIGKRMVNLNIKEVEKPELEAQLVVQNIIDQLEKRIRFRRVAKKAIASVKQAGAEGVKVILKGRLDGDEIARTETFTEGKIPLHTLRADIDYAQGAAYTTYGTVGVKVWVYKGEVFEKEKFPSS